MIPFSLDKLLTKLDHELSSIQKDLIKNKFLFCQQFKKDLGMLRQDAYAQEVFDFAYNLFTFKKSISEKDFKMWLEDLKDCNFIDELKTRSLFPIIYTKMLFSYKRFFMDYLKLEHEDENYVKYKFNQNKTEFIERLIEV